MSQKINFVKTDDKIKFIYQKPNSSLVSFDKALKMIVKLGNSDLFEKAKKIQSLEIIKKQLDETDFETAKPDLVRKFKDIFYLKDDWEDDQALEDEITEKYKKVIRKKTGKNYDARVARKMATMEIVYLRYVQLQDVLKDQEKRLKIENKVLAELNNAEPINIALAAENLNPENVNPKDEDEILDGESDFSYGKIKPEDWQWVLKGKKGEIKDKEEETLHESIKKKYIEKLNEGKIKLYDKKKSELWGKTKLRKTFKRKIKKSANKNTMSAVNNVSQEKGKQANSNLERSVKENCQKVDQDKFNSQSEKGKIDEKKISILEEIKKKRASRVSRVVELMTETDAKLKELATECATINDIKENLLVGVNHEVKRNTWINLANSKMTDSDETLKAFLKQAYDNSTDKDMTLGGIVLGIANVLIALNNKIHKITGICNGFINYFAQLERYKTEMAKMGRNAQNIENRQRVKQDLKTIDNNFVSQEEWDKMSPKEKIQKRFKFTDRSQNPPNYLFKKLSIEEKKTVLKAKKDYRSKRIIELYDLTKTDQIKAALEYDNIKFYENRDKYGFRISDEGLAKEFEDSEEDKQIKEELELNWREQASKKRIFNIVMYNSKRIYSNGKAAEDCIQKKTRTSRFRFKRRKYLTFKRKRNGDFQEYENISKEHYEDESVGVNFHNDEDEKMNVEEREGNSNNSKVNFL